MSLNLTPSKGEEAQLRAAASQGNIEQVKSLLVDGANINGENNYGQRALHNAAAGGFSELVVYLLKSGAVIDARTKAGDTPLISAARSNHPQVVDLLIKEGTNVNGLNSDGWAALHFAVERHHEAVVSVLLQYGTDPTLLTKDGKLPNDLLGEHASAKLKDLLNDAIVQREVRSPHKKNPGLLSPVCRNLSSPQPESTPPPSQNRLNRSLATEFNSSHFSTPQTFGNWKTENIGQVEAVSEVRSAVVERLIEVVEKQAIELDLLRQDVSKLNMRVNELSRIGFPHTLELKLDGRIATYALGKDSTTDEQSVYNDK